MALFEIFLIQYDMVDGNKIFKSGPAWSVNLPVTNTSVTRKSSGESIPGYADSEPRSVLTGQEPSQVIIEGPLCKISNVSVINNITALPVKHMVNLFPVCAKIHVSGIEVNTDVGGEDYIIESFSIKRNIQKRYVITYSLSIRRWYNAGE